MNELFKNKKVQKTYYAITEDMPKNDKGVIISLLKKKSKSRTNHTSLNQMMEKNQSSI